MVAHAVARSFADDESSFRVQEMQHRVANSLQIVASLLMQSARKTASEEARLNLLDAHGRVIAIAAVQRRLAHSDTDDVDLRGYFDLLCEGLSDALIGDPARQSIVVDVDDVRVEADAAVNLGLIATELIINAIKHAFPGGRSGRITVRYRASGQGWSLTVADDGVGMPATRMRATPGLGTNIIEALARHLHANTVRLDGPSGATVSIIHRPTSPA